MLENTNENLMKETYTTEFGELYRHLLYILS